jgi:hypothetical protein
MNKKMNNVHTLTEIINNNNKINNVSENSQITNIFRLRGVHYDLSPLDLEIERIKKYKEENTTYSFIEAFPKFKYNVSSSSNTYQLNQVNVDVENTEEVVSLFEIIKKIYVRFSNNSSIMYASESELAELNETIDSLNEEILKDPDSYNLNKNIKNILNKALSLKEKLSSQLENISDQLYISNIGNLTVIQVINTAINLYFSSFINSTDLKGYTVKLIPALFVYRDIFKLFIKHCETKKDNIKNILYSFEQRRTLMRTRNLPVGVTMLLIAPVVILILIKSSQLNIFDAFNVKFNKTVTTDILSSNGDSILDFKDTHLLGFLLTFYKKNFFNAKGFNWFKFIIIVVLSFIVLLFIYLFDLFTYLIFIPSIFFTFKNFLIISILASIVGLIYSILTYVLISIFENQDLKTKNLSKNFKLEKSLIFKFKIINYFLEPIILLATHKTPNKESDLSDLFKKNSLKYIYLYIVYIVIALYIL